MISPHHRNRTGILLFIYTLSGVTALSYEVLWARMLGLQFGVSIFGVTITVTAFMAGLGLGSLLLLRWRHRIVSPLLLFAVLEGGVAVYALSLPWLIQRADGWISMTGNAAGLAQWYTLEACAALLLLLLPALAMGAGFPLVLKAIERLPFSLAKVYGLNTLGGAIGALLPLWTLPVFGWLTSVQLVAGLGLLVAATAYLLSRPATGTPAQIQIQIPKQIPEQPTALQASRPGLGVLAAYAGLGAAALMLEIGWTRLFGMILLRTEYVLAIILAVYLLGIGTGSLLVRRRLHRRWMDTLPVVTATFGLLSLWGIPVLSRWLGLLQFDSLAGALAWQGLAIVALTLPVTLALGAWLPLLSMWFGRDADTGPWLYGANSLGAALGAMVMGFVLIPVMGTTAAVATASLALFVFGMVWCQQRRIWILAPLLLILAWPVAQWPSVENLLPDIQAGSKDLYRYEDAVSITHVVERPDGQRLLLSDLQRMDASSDPTAVALQKDQALLPLLLHPQPRNALFLGLGTGISASGTLADPAVAVTAVELSRGAIVAASDWFGVVNDDVMHHIDVIRDDARRYLRTTSTHYDVIIGDVFHPDMVGRGNLLSVQQFRRARDHLAPAGLFVQWLALNQFDPASLSIVMRSFHQVFPDAVLFIDGFRLAMVGKLGDFRAAAALSVAPVGTADHDTSRANGGEGLWTWLGRYCGTLDVGPGAVQDEWAPRIEYYLPRARYRSEFDLANILSWLLQRRPELSSAMGVFGIGARDREAFERGYIATDLAMRSWLADLRGDDGRAQRLIRLAYNANPQDRWAGSSLADKMLATLTQAIKNGLSEREALQRILKIRSDHVATLRRLWHLEREAGNDAQARAYLAQLARISPLDREVRAAQ